jgi:adenine-specific DNA-methyltransferase
MGNNMSNEQKTTGNITPPNKDLETLKNNFPYCFDKNGNFDFEKFKKQLSKNEINFSKESYGMDWLGKSYARLLATDETTTLLKEDEIFNQKEENKNSENLLIKGDNLEVLKHLSNAYYEKIKMIYIDPPYNTGSDGFVYQDDRKFTAQELQELAGISEERAKQILDFTESNSNSHSAWLTFMYPRLYIAKQLLKEDGVIFISIDDNEVTQLRMLMDEIFGEENFEANIIPIVNPGGRDYKQVAVTNEYILVYSKTEELEINELQKNEKFKLLDSQGGYNTRELRNRNPKFHSGNRPNLFYPFYVNPEQNKDGYCNVSLKKSEEYTIEIKPYNSVGKESVWRWGKDKSNTNIVLSDFDTTQILAKQKKDGGWNIYEKNRRSTTKVKSVWTDSGMRTENGTRTLRSLFGDNYFNHPKPIDLIKRCCQIGSNEGEIILDFFAGSGTTADAVMQLGAEGGGNRKFILAQLPELIDQKNNKTAYDFVKNELKVETPTIFEITKERLIRASKKIQEENKDKDLSNQDLGFKIFETMPIWEDYNFEADELDAQQMLLFDESKLTKEDIKALLVTWKTYDGVSLSQSLQNIDLTDYTANYSNGKLYLMDKGFKTKNLKTLLEKIDSDKNFNPTTIIAFGYHFESKNLREISENIKSYTNKKSIDIDFITRY